MVAETVCLAAYPSMEWPGPAQSVDGGGNLCEGALCDGTAECLIRAQGRWEINCRRVLGGGRGGRFEV